MSAINVRLTLSQNQADIAAFRGGDLARHA
jgi:hypothetical protein